MLFWTALVQGGMEKIVCTVCRDVGVFVFWLNLSATGGVEELRYASKEAPMKSHILIPRIS